MIRREYGGTGHKLVEEMNQRLNTLGFNCESDETGRVFTVLNSKDIDMETVAMLITDVSRGWALQLLPETDHAGNKRVGLIPKSDKVIIASTKVTMNLKDNGDIDVSPEYLLPSQPIWENVGKMDSFFNNKVPKTMLRDK